MRGIPPEIDQLMWKVAEQENSAAADEFLLRYPVYREELMRRREAVSGLKTGRPRLDAPAHAIPRFTPREARRVAPAPRQVALVFGLVLAAVALGSYTVTLLMSPAPKLTEAAPKPTPGVTQQIPPVQETRPEHPVPRVDQPPPAMQQDPPKEPETPKYLRPQSLVVKKATLTDVLKLLGAQAGVEIVVAPGLENPTVAVEYHDMNAVEMLQDLGSQYKFTPFDQGDGSIIVYPAVDPSAGNLRRLGG